MNFVNASAQWIRFDLQGTNQTLAGVNAGSLTTQAGAIIQNQNLQGFNPGQNATLTLNGSGTYVYNGYIRDQDNGGTTNKVNLVKDGSGTQTLVGSVVTYTGTTTVNNGTLELYNASGFNSATTINSGGTLKFSNTASIGSAAGFTVTLNNGATLTHNGLTNGGDFWVLSGALTNSGSTTDHHHKAQSRIRQVSTKDCCLDGGLHGKRGTRHD